MSKNKTLTAAKNAKNDEFYTQYADIAREMEAYLDYDADAFRGKSVLLPCDDPEWSNFTKYFAENFERLGLKKLVSTSFAFESKKISAAYLPGFESLTAETIRSSPKFDKGKERSHGKIFVLDEDTNRSGRIDIDDLKWEYLKGDGDFRSAEVRKLRDEADVIVTNPPFSLFREFLAWILEGEKEGDGFGRGDQENVEKGFLTQRRRGAESAVARDARPYQADANVVGIMRTISFKPLPGLSEWIVL